MAKASTSLDIAQAILLRIDKATIEELRKSSKPDFQFLAGPNPRIRLNGIFRDLKSVTISRTDLYSYTSSKSSSTVRNSSSSSPSQSPQEFANWSQVATASERFEVKREQVISTHDSVGEDAALAALEESLATLEKEKQANSTHITTSVIQNTNGKRRDMSNRRVPAREPVPLSRLTASTTDKTKRQPIVAGHNDDTSGQSDAYRKVLIHFLAMEPASIETLAKQTCISQSHLKQVLPRIAAETRTGGQMWELTHRAYKDLDVWKFPYRKNSDRQRAIDNAIKAYDRLRLARDDKLWQLLLTPSERNKGTVLSKLVLAVGAQHSSANTPSADILAEKKTSSTTGTPRMGTGSPRPNSGKTTTSAAKRLFAKDPQKAQQARKLEDAKEQKKKEREAAKQKLQNSPKKPNNRPLVPSPLGGRPRVASDVSERAPASSIRSNPSSIQSKSSTDRSEKLGSTAEVKSTSSVPRPTPSANKTAKPPTNTISTAIKRKAYESIPDTRPIVKHRKTDSVSSHSVQSVSSTNPNSTAHTSPDVNFDGGGNSDSSSSVNEDLSFMQSVTLAEKFQDHYYPAYAKMYDEQVAKEKRGEYVGKDERERLWAMHRRLEQMKREIETASKRQRRENV